MSLRPWPRSEAFHVTLLTALALGLRLYRLDAQSLWLDEASSVWVASQNDVASFFQTLGTDESSPPLYFLALHAWMKLFGSSETAIRLVSALSGTACVPIGYLLARKLFDLTTARIAALWIAVSGVMIQYSQEARPYSLLLLTALGSSLALLGAQHGSRIPRSYVLATAFMAYTHVYAVFVALGQAWIFWLRTRDRGIWLKTYGLIGVMALPAIALLQSRMALFSAGHGFQPEETLPLIAQLQTLGTILFGGPLQGLWAIGLCFLGIRAKLRPEGLQLLLWGTLPIVLPMIATYATGKPFFLFRYASVTAPAYFILAAHGISRVSKGWGAAALAVLLLISQNHLTNYFGRAQKEDWRTVAQLIRDNRAPGDALFLHSDYCKKALGFYLKENLPAILTARDFPGPLASEEWRKAMASANRVWLVLSNTSETDAAALGEALRTLFPGLRPFPGRTREGDHFGISLYLFSPGTSTKSL